MQTSLIGLEACSEAHFLGRALRKQGHDVRLIPAQFVKPFVKSNKNDFVDAEAIAEAVERENMRFVPIKTDDQLDLQAIHRVRDRLISRRAQIADTHAGKKRTTASHVEPGDAEEAEAVECGRPRRARVPAFGAMDGSTQARSAQL